MSSETAIEDRRETVFSVDSLSKSFGGLSAVDGATFDVDRGRITGLIGPNGAGKSTIFNLVSGFLNADSGTVRFDGQEVTGMEPHELVERGMVRTFQSARTLEEMTVRENLALAAKQPTGERFLNAVTPRLRDRVLSGDRAVHERVDELLDLFDLDHLADELGKNLSGGQRKLLVLSRALITDPEMLLLDEPFAGVNPTLANRLIEHLESLRNDGYTILLVEHDMEVVMNHCDYVVVLHQGRVLAEGPPESIRDNETVIEAYLGGDV
jgi:branched-chain amino acid transport system ATP-binding protein